MARDSGYYKKWDTVNIIGASIAAGLLGGALWQAILIRDSEHRQLRAYVGIDIPTPLTTAVSSLKNLTGHLKLRNFGQTPALSVVFQADMDVRDYPLAPDNSFVERFVEPPESITVFPGTSNLWGVDANLKHPLSDKDLFDIRDGSHRRLYLWGKVQYLDIFNCQHYTNFCISLSGLTTDAVGSIKMEPCSKYNDSN